MKAPAFLVSSTERRVALFYFTAMMPLGAAVVQAGVWFAENGISSGGIGVINAVPVLIMIGLNLTLGRIADRASDWRQAIVVAAAFQGAVTLGLFFVDGFWGILAVWTLSVLPNLSIGPVLDAASMRMTRRNGTSFGPLRACATVGYLLMVGLTGVLVTRFGGAIFVPFYVGLTLLKAFAAQLLPTFRAPPGTADPSGDRGASHLSEVMQGWFVLPLLGYAMVFGTHIILNAFAALLWRSQGIPAATVGQLIMLGAIAEAGMMFAWGRVRGRITPEAGLLLAGLVATFRWIAMALAPPVPVLVGLQLLHAITFALGYLSVVQFIASHTRDRIAAEAQSFYVVLQQIMSVTAVLAFGYLGQSLGFHAYFAAAGFALLGSAIIVLGIRALRPVAEDGIG
jgi:MFS transporter, PPP family, 3-phenylpropionic acid transporter